MAATDFIVAIELGSSKITGIAGKKHPDGSIQVLALASGIDIKGFYRKGICRHRRTIAPHYPQHGSTPLGRRN